MITALVVIAVTVTASAVLFALRGCRCRWLNQPDQQDEL